MDYDFTDDWKVWDNVESVALVTGVTSQTFTNWPTTAKRRQLRYRELVASGGAYTSQDLVWLIPTQFLPVYANPKLGDRLTDQFGATWTVIEAALNTWRTWWSVTCRNLVLVNGLADTADLYRPTNNQDIAAGRLPVYATVTGSTDLPIKVQEQDATVEEKNGKRQATRRFVGYCGQRIYPQAQDRIVTSDGTIYQLTGWRSADRLDLLMELDLEIVT